MSFENPLTLDQADDFGNSGIIDLDFEGKFQHHSTAKSAERRIMKKQL